MHFHLRRSVIKYQRVRFEKALSGSSVNYLLLDGILMTDYDENWRVVYDVDNEFVILIDLEDPIAQITTTAITILVEAVEEVVYRVRKFLNLDEIIIMEQKVTIEEKQNFFTFLLKN